MFPMVRDVDDMVYVWSLVGEAAGMMINNKNSAETSFSLSTLNIVLTARQMHKKSGTASAIAAKIHKVRNLSKKESFLTKLSGIFPHFKSLICFFTSRI